MSLSLIFGGWNAPRKVPFRYVPIEGNERQAVILAEVVKTNDIFLLYLQLALSFLFGGKCRLAKCEPARWAEKKKEVPR